ncbi:hypothetical protein [Cytobacillus praedii]|uniref:hypothetical protein n=1 Tax=Cytobacillus praedii TaxID=1742358 RepID=UPI002E1EAF30|nr:hypothetical protein [Cytobacillus praedii]
MGTLLILIGVIWLICLMITAVREFERKETPKIAKYISGIGIWLIVGFYLFRLIFD